MKKYFCKTLFLLFLFLNFASAQSNINQLIQQGLEKAYNMELDAAEKIYNRAIQRAPNLPHGYFRIAQLHFWTFLGTRDMGEYHIFQKFADLAQEKIDNILNKNKKNYRITYMAGNLATYKAMVYATNNSSVDAFWHCKKAVEYFERTLKLNPRFYDAYLGLGLFDYAMSFVPDFLKWAVNLTGLTSDKERGLKYIKLAYNKGTYEKTEAAFHLAKIYSDYLANYDSSYFYLQNIISKYPNNSLFRYQYAVTLIRNKRLNDAINVLNNVISLDNKKFPQITALAHYRKGEIYFKKNQFKNAIKYYKIFLETTKETDLTGIAALNTALSYKILGNDEEYKNYLDKIREGNQDLFEDAYAKEIGDYFADNGISSGDILLIKMKNNIDAGKYRIVYDSLKSKIEDFQNDRKGLALIYFSEAALNLRKLTDAIKSANEIQSVHLKRVKWVIPFSNFILAKANYLSNHLKEAKEFLIEAENNNNYEFKNYIQSQIENLKRKLYRK